jgi:hypothetical protein
VEVPSEAEVLTECNLRAIPAETGRKFWRHFETKKGGWSGIEPGKWKLKLWDWHQNDLANGVPGKKSSAAATGASELREIEAELQWQTEAVRVQTLKKRREELSALGTPR